MKNKIELKTKEVLSIGKRLECARCQIQFIIHCSGNRRIIYLIDER